MASKVLMPSYVNSQMNLGAPELEYIDPTPDIHALFLHFDLIFFKSSLKSRATVRWSKRMYSCAGVCAYEGRSGFCDIAISEPLLKLRPRKDLVETLLHEMIHAYLFITDRDTDRDGHGPNFHFHMNRINKMAGLNISVYHDFHAEVELYQTHWWRCDGICRNSRPYYGIVRRSSNRPPGPNDHWWDSHKRWCGGNYIKIKQPESKATKTRKGKVKEDVVKPNIYSIDAKTVKTLENYLKKKADTSIPTVVKDKENSSKTISKKSEDNLVKTPASKIKSINDYYAKKTAGTDISITVVTNVNEIKNKENKTSTVHDKVRNHWATYPYPANTQNNINNKLNNNKPNKHKIDTIDTSQPKRTKKIDDYFKANAKSILEDIYGPSLKIVEGSNNEKLKAVIEPVTYVNCPICNDKVISTNINSHVDECLNKDVIDILQKENSDNLDTSNKPINKEHIIENPECNDVKHIDVKPDITQIKINQEINKFDDTSLRNSNIQPSIAPKIEVKTEPNLSIEIKTEPSTSYNIKSEDNIAYIQECACCGEMVQKPMQDHLEECLAFFKNNTTVPEEGMNQSTSSIIIVDDDDDDQFNESQTLNPTGTKYPCPSCLTLIENDEMNSHLDSCLN